VPPPANLQLAELSAGLSLSSETPNSSSIETEKPLVSLERMQCTSLLQRGGWLEPGYLCGAVDISAA